MNSHQRRIKGRALIRKRKEWDNRYAPIPLVSRREENLALLTAATQRLCSRWPNVGKSNFRYRIFNE